MKKWLMTVAVALAVAGCSSDKIEVPKTVVVEVQVPCKTNLPARPSFPDTDQALRAMPHPDALAHLLKKPSDAKARREVQENNFYLMQRLSAGRPMHYAWEDQLETALKGCS